MNSPMNKWFSKVYEKKFLTSSLKQVFHWWINVFLLPSSHWIGVVWFDVFPGLFKECLEDSQPGSEKSTAWGWVRHLFLVMLLCFFGSYWFSWMQFYSLPESVCFPSGFYGVFTALILLQGALKCCEVYVGSWLNQISQG